MVESNTPLKVKVAVADLDGILRGKYMHYDKFKSALQEGFGFCNVVLGWDMLDECYPAVPYTGWHSAYPDAKTSIDEATERNIPWENELPFYLADFSNDKNASLICPRSILKKVEQKAASMGYKALCAQEFEWFNFYNQGEDHVQKPETITSGMYGYSILKSSYNSPYFHQLFDDLNAFKIPLEGLHTETGPGVFEAAIQKTSLLEAADRAVLFKTAVKEIAYKNGYKASFMAKWNADLPGCSGHIHQSLWSLDKDETIFGKDESGNELLKHFIAGQLHCLPHLLPMYAPTINSYKRLVKGTWAPINASWGVENRTCAVRAISSAESGWRAEMRVPGSDSNPYLAMAASVASGLFGIQNKLELQEPIVGNAYEADKAIKFPSSLEKATILMKSSSIAKELFGDAFVEHFCYTREQEVEKYNTSVSDWELNRYFTII